MPRPKKQPEQEDEPQGAPEWMVTFSDCMTLLLTFFVLLLTFSSFDERVFRKLRVIYCDAFSTIYSRVRASKESFIDFQRPINDEIDQGSERPTLDQTYQGAIKEGTSDLYQKHKVFVAASENIFWANGTTISITGHKTLITLAEFLKKVPGQIIICETGPDKSQRSINLGLERSWQIVQFMTTRCGIDPDRLNISLNGTAANKAFEILRLDSNQTNNRVLEIALLDKSIYE